MRPYSVSLFESAPRSRSALSAPSTSSRLPSTYASGRRRPLTQRIPLLPRFPSVSGSASSVTRVAFLDVAEVAAIDVDVELARLCSLNRELMAYRTVEEKVRRLHFCVSGSLASPVPGIRWLLWGISHPV